MGDDAQLRGLIDEIYSAALTQEDPTPLYGRVAECLGFTAAGLVTVRSRLMEPTCHAAWGIDVAVCQRMEERYAMTRSVIERLGGKIWPGDFHFRDEMISEDDFRDQPAFQEFHRRYGLEDGATVCLENSSDRMIFLNLAGPVPGADRERQRKMLEVLAPHWVRATQIFHRLGQLEQFEFAFGQMTNAAPLPLIVFDNTGALHSMNRRAEDLLRRRDGLELAQGNLHATLDTDSQRLKQLIRSATGHAEAARQPPPGESVQISRRTGKRSYRLQVIPLSAARQRDARYPAALVVIFDPEAEIEVSLARCCEVFGFTPAEAQVALGIMNGRSIEQVAASRGRSLATSRNLLKRAFAKAGVNRQSELTHLMLNSPLFLGLDVTVAPPPQRRTEARAGGRAFFS